MQAIRKTTFEAIGTHWQIDVREVITGADWERLSALIQERIEQFDKNYSRFRTDSLVTQLAQRAGTYELPTDGYQLLSFYEQLYSATSGKVTPLIGQVMSDAGYDAAYSLQSGPLQSPEQWHDVLRYTKTTITLQKPVLLDFGAAGKGYLVDIVGGLLEEAGVHNFTVNAGGDIMHRSTTSELLSVGLENPQDTSEVVGIAQLGNQSLCASAGRKRAWGNFHHIIDPSSLKSPSKIMSVWVQAEDTMTADGLATALFFVEPPALKQFEFSYALLHDDMTMSWSKDFPVQLFKEARG